MGWQLSTRWGGNLRLESVAALHRIGWQESSEYAGWDAFQHFSGGNTFDGLHNLGWAIRGNRLKEEVHMIFIRANLQLDSGEFCEWLKLNTRGYPCTLGVPPHSVHQKGYPLAQAYCTAFAYTAGLFVWFALASAQAPMAARASPCRRAGGLRSTAENHRWFVAPAC